LGSQGKKESFCCCDYRLVCSVCGRRKEAKERLFYGNQTNDFIDILLRRLLRSPASFFSFLLLPFHLEIDKKRKEEKSLNLCDDDDADGVCVCARCV
jgi:hypothetical protein